MSDNGMGSGSELGEILADQVDRLLADTSTREVKRDAELGTWPEALWAQVEEAGLPLALVSEGRTAPTTGTSARDCWML